MNRDKLLQSPIQMPPKIKVMDSTFKPCVIPIFDFGGLVFSVSFPLVTTWNGLLHLIVKTCKVVRVNIFFPGE